VRSKGTGVVLYLTILAACGIEGLAWNVIEQEFARDKRTYCDLCWYGCVAQD
jgi:hypothetical protein